MNFAMICLIVGMGLFAAAAFILAANRRPDEYRYWHIRFTAGGIEDDITFFILPNEDPNVVASYAVERYCENMDRRISEIITMEEINFDEYATIRKRLFSKLNHPVEL